MIKSVKMDKFKISADEEEEEKKLKKDEFSALSLDQRDRNREEISEKWKEDK